jgi:hypothetical protein
VSLIKITVKSFRCGLKHRLNKCNIIKVIQIQVKIENGKVLLQPRIRGESSGAATAVREDEGGVGGTAVARILQECATVTM